MNETADFINDTIAKHFDFIEHPHVILGEDAFEEEYGCELQAAYGWTLPVNGAFCIDRINRQTIHLNEEDLKDYLNAILWIIDRHVVLAYEEPELAELDRHHKIESELYDIAPESMKLLSSVEVKVLDEA